jgi:hypothetical protein
MSLFRCLALVMIAGASLEPAQSPDAVRKEIEGAYTKVLDALKQPRAGPVCGSMVSKTYGPRSNPRR